MLRSSQGMIRPHHSRLAMRHRIADGLCIFASLFAACSILDKPCGEQYVGTAAFAVGLFYLFAENNDLYRSWRGAAFRQELMRIYGSWFGVAAIILVIAFAFKIEQNIRGWLCFHGLSWRRCSSLAGISA